MSFGLYLGGLVVVLIGVLYGAHLMHVPQHWLIVIALVFVGAGIVGAVNNTRRRDPS